MSVGVARSRARRDGADRREPDRAADLATRVHEPGGHTRIGALHAGEACDRDRHEGEAEARPADHEGREEVPEVLAVHRHLREQANRDRRERKAHHQRRADADPLDHRLREVRGDDHGEGEGDERDAALHGRVVKDVLHVEREHEELRERDSSDQCHRRVRGRECAEPEDPQRQERPARARFDPDERRDERSSAGEQPDRDGRAPAVARRARQRIDEQHQPAGDGRGAGQVEVAVRQLRAAVTKQERR